ncbi:winged helix-turn-helix domain-containing protein [Streptomyces anulatus]|uniref:winged helix-turn-helix domain-containing protein n=1 Tax=Streptomyces anulatus TaxID=1892 RepID=UPI0036F80589
MSTSDAPHNPPRRLTDPASMRALSHPIRLALVEALIMHVSLTATQAGKVIGETPTSCSFHLRQLAKYGFIEESDPMPGRSRPWRMKRLGWLLEREPGDEAQAAAARHLGEMTLNRQLERHRTHGHGSTRAHTIWWVTPEEAAELHAGIEQLVMRFRDRLQDPGARPADAEAVEVVVLTHPFA